jgi:two-component system CheB/CheR fusion protein
LGNFKFIIAIKDMFKELKKDKPVIMKMSIETATGQKINVDFTLNMYIVDNHEVMQCFITFLFVDSK